MLTDLQALDPDMCGIVRWLGNFNHGPHACLVFELLDQSLLDFAWQRADHTLPLMQIKEIVQQVGPQPQLNCSVVALETKHIVVFCVS